MDKIAVIGLVGKTIFMEVPRFHEGGETIVAKGIHEEWGGKGFNQAIAAARQDAAVSFLGAASAADAKAIADFCRAEGVTAKMCVKRLATACAAILTDGTKCTEAFAAAMAACEQAGGGHCRHPLRLERRAQEERFCLALQIIGRSGETPLPQGVHRPCVRLCRHNDLSSLGDRRGAGPFA